MNTHDDSERRASAVYVLDRQQGQERRPWNRWLAGYDVRAPSWMAPAKPGDARTWIDKPASGAVLVCHQLDDGDRPVVDELLRDGVFVLRVSRTPGDGLLKDGSYARKKVVQTADASFATCLRRFVDDLKETGRPNWLLIEGPPPPDALLAYHLLALLAGDPDADKEREALRPKALREAEDIATILGLGSEKGLTDFEDPEKGAERRRAFLRECR